MIYGTRLNNSIIVGAADESAEFVAFYKTVMGGDSSLIIDHYRPDVLEMLGEIYSGFSISPHVFTVTDPDDFVATYSVNIIPLINLKDKQSIMVQKDQDDPWAFGAKDTRTIAQIHGIEENDPHDRRSEKDKARDAEYKKIAEKAKKEGKISGDSFGSGDKLKTSKKSRSTVITDIGVSRNTDGSINIDHVRAVQVKNDDKEDSSTVVVQIDGRENEVFYRFTGDQGIFGHNIVNILQLLGEELPTPELHHHVIVAQDESGHSKWFAVRGEKLANKLAFWLDHTFPNITMEIVDKSLNSIEPFIPNADIARHIDPNGQIAIYHRIDVTNIELEPLLDIIAASLKKDSMTLIVAARGYVNPISWLACVSKAGAETIEEIIKAAGYSTETYGVNDIGERLVPKNVTIVEEETKKEFPRPWNSRAKELEDMTDAEREANLKTLTGNEFIYCGNSIGHGKGTILYITPRSYFNEHDEPWENTLDGWIVLPPDVKELAPGVYKTMSKDWLRLNNVLDQLGYVESLVLMLYYNNI